MPTVPDPSFIRRAVELADLDAVRVALYQQTRDPEVAALPVAVDQDDAQRGRLIELATEWLSANAGPDMPELPPRDELRTLMTMATGREMSDLEFEARRGLPAFEAFPWTATWTDSPPDLPDGFRVAVVGSGFSGLAMAVQLELLGIPYVVLERRPEPGGTWTINRYPDVRVDTISITYEFAFEKRYPWTEYFGRGAEVREYLDHISRKYGVRANTLFEHDLVRATFDDERDTWVLDVSTPDGPTTIEAAALVNAVGTFANPRYPDIEGLDRFEGEVLHPNRWPADWDATGRRVAIIGNGSTGVQLLAPIAAEAEQVHVLQRTPQWISPRAKYGQPVEPEVRWLIDHFPGYWNWWRYMAIAALFETHRFLDVDDDWKAGGGHVNPANDQLRADLTAYIEAETGGRPDLVERLVPDYAPFSRRPVVDNGWYRALTRDNVELVTEPIARMVPEGIELEDGRVLGIDTLVTATGFHVSRYLWPARYHGTEGRELHETWAEDGPRAYLGMLVPHFPNMFMLYGPNSQPLSGGTGLPIWYGVWAAYVGQCLVRMLEEGATRVEVTPDAHDRYNAALDREARDLLVMRDEGAPDKNYYVNQEHGRLQVSAPWYGPEFHRMCTEVDWDDVRIG